MPSFLAVSVAVAVALTAGPAPAAAGPPDPGHLAAVLPTVADIPAGYTVTAPDPEPVADQIYGYFDPCAYDRDEDSGTTISAPGLRRTFVRGGRDVTVTLGAPGAHWAHETVRELVELPTRCPDYSDAMSEVDHEYRRLPLPGVGGDAAGLADIWSVTMYEGGLNWGQVRTAAVAHGDLVMTFSTGRDRDDPEFVPDSEFAAIVAAGARRLAAHQQPR